MAGVQSDERVPLVGIVVVNYHRDDLTVACLDALARSTWPAERMRIAVVDNGSDDGFASHVADRSGVVYVPAGRNAGFPGGCNLGIAALVDSCDLIGLLNNDATPEPGWLEPLVDELESDERIGGVTPRLVLAGRYARLRFRGATRRAGSGDARDLGVQLSGVRIDGHDVTDDVELGQGFWGWEHGEPAGRFAWTAADATALVRTDDESDGDIGRIEVRLSSVLGPVRATTDAGAGAEPTTLDVGPRPEWFVVADRAAPVRLINSTGIELHPDGSCGDRDYFALEDAVADTPRETFGCSGAAVLFRREFLRDVGPMDERFFLYYEDADLCWRGRLNGWQFRYASDSVVVHEHSATVGSNSRLAAHLASRNRLVMLTKVAPRRLAFAAATTMLSDLRRAAWNDVARRLLQRRRPETAHVTTLGRVMLGYLRLLPYAVVERRRLGRRAQVDRTRAMRTV